MAQGTKKFNVFMAETKWSEEDLARAVKRTKAHRNFYGMLLLVGLVSLIVAQQAGQTFAISEDYAHYIIYSRNIPIGIMVIIIFVLLGIYPMCFNLFDRKKQI